MADDKKTDAADPRDALLAKLQAENAALSKKAKADAAAIADKDDYLKELEAELKEAASDVTTAPKDLNLVAQLVAGQKLMQEAIAAALGSNPKDKTHAEALAAGEHDLKPEHKGVHYYRRTRPGYARGKYYEAGLTYDRQTGQVGNLKILTDGAPGSTDVEVDSKGVDLVKTEAPQPGLTPVDGKKSDASSPSNTEV